MHFIQRLAHCGGSFNWVSPIMRFITGPIGHMLVKGVSLLPTAALATGAAFGIKKLVEKKDE